MHTPCTDISICHNAPVYLFLYKINYIIARSKSDSVVDLICYLSSSSLTSFLLALMLHCKPRQHAWVHVCRYHRDGTAQTVFLCVNLRSVNWILSALICAIVIITVCNIFFRKKNTVRCLCFHSSSLPCNCVQCFHSSSLPCNFVQCFYLPIFA